MANFSNSILTSLWILIYCKFANTSIYQNYRHNLCFMELTLEGRQQLLAFLLERFNGNSLVRGSQKEAAKIFDVGKATISRL
jgi:hypothetical protein